MNGQLLLSGCLDRKSLNPLYWLHAKNNFDYLPHHMQMLRQPLFENRCHRLVIRLVAQFTSFGMDDVAIFIYNNYVSGHQTAHG
jgi:hypothetical protein